jgi:hypothetical protein
MPSPPPYTKKQLQLLNYAVEPSGKTVDELARTTAGYLIVSAHASEALEKDPTRVRELDRLVSDPATRPPHLTPMDAGLIEVGKDERWDAMELLARYDAILAKPPKTIDECVRGVVVVDLSDCYVVTFNSKFTLLQRY